jgi:hypothetical protein
LLIFPTLSMTWTCSAIEVRGDLRSHGTVPKLLKIAVSAET